MIFHSYHLDGIINYPFYSGYIFVEVFFLLTGYFTVVHFENLDKQVGFKTAITSVIKYTIRKFSRFLPYTFIAVMFSLLLRHIIIDNDFQPIMFVKAILEAMLLIRGDANVGVLWFLAAMLMVFPMFCLMIHKMPFKLTFCFAVFICLIYYRIATNGDCFFPMHYIRALAGLFLGVITYGVATIIKKFCCIEKRRLITCITYVMLVIPILLTAINKFNMKGIIVCFVGGFSLLFSELPRKLNGNRFTEWCKKYSLTLYIVHLNIADLTCYISQNIATLRPSEQYFIYVVLSIFTMSVLEMIVVLIKNSMSILRLTLSEERFL